MHQLGAVAMRVVGVVYLLLGAWCTAKPKLASEWVGYSLVGGNGRSEFVVVYGGLEVGLGLAFVVTSIVPEWQAGGLAFGALLSLALPVFRAWTVRRDDVERSVYMLFVVELLFALALAIPAFARR